MPPRTRTCAAVAIAAAVLAASGCGAAGVAAQDEALSAPAASPAAKPIPTATRAPAKAGQWGTVTPWPYVAWYGVATAWTGKELLVFGGANPHDAGAQDVPGMPTGRAAGAYDPERDSWRPIAPAPLHGSGLVVAGGTVYGLLQEPADRGGLKAEQLWAYDVPTDAWRRLADPPTAAHHSGITAAGSTLVTWEGNSYDPAAGPVRLYDIATDTWRVSPATPWGTYGNRSVAGLPDGRIVAVEAPARPIPTVPPSAATQCPDPCAEAHVVHGGEVRGPSEENPAPGWRAAILDPGAKAWRAMPRPRIAALSYAKGDWRLVAGKVVHLSVETLPAAHVQGGGKGPVPLGGALDPDAGRWEKLPVLPGELRGEPFKGRDSRLRIGAAEENLAAYRGWVYDGRHRRWVELPRIPGEQGGLAWSIEAWAGDRLLVFANATFADDEFGADLEPVRKGWSWRAPHVTRD